MLKSFIALKEFLSIVPVTLVQAGLTIAAPDAPVLSPKDLPTEFCFDLNHRSRVCIGLNYRAITVRMDISTSLSLWLRRDSAPETSHCGSGEFSSIFLLLSLALLCTI